MYNIFISILYTTLYNYPLLCILQDSDKMDRELEIISQKKDEERRRLLLELEKSKYSKIYIVDIYL
jgi:hypothetical protein